MKLLSGGSVVRSRWFSKVQTDLDARLYRKGMKGRELRFMSHTLMDNRHGLIANAVVTMAKGHAEREAAKAMTRKNS